MRSIKYIFLAITGMMMFSCNSPKQEANELKDESGYEMWLRYKPVEDKDLLASYKEYSAVYTENEHQITTSAINELKTAFDEICHSELSVADNANNAGIILKLDKRLEPDGYRIINEGNKLAISGQNNAGILYGVFELIRQMQLHQPLKDILIEDYPRVNLRMLNHWDNMGGGIERGYAGESIWDWETLPISKQRYIDYARFLASVGINGTVINNVNANPKMLKREYILRYEGLADIFREYGIKLFVSANYASPIEIGGLENADPLNPKVAKWWQDKIDEIYSIIPDFGGFLVKADSEGQPGPYMYGRTHAQGANMLAESFEKHGGLVIWRAFVYGVSSDDRAKQAYNFFEPQDGQFADNVILQIKNGPVDFQVNEPVHPLFGAMPETNQMIELQITQEYTGRQIALNHLAPYWKSVLHFDTYQKGKGSEVYKVVDGSLFDQENTGIAGVSNIGSDTNWTGHHLAQSNFYSFGRLAWNPKMSIDTITDEWIRLTFGNDEKIRNVISEMLLQSHDIYAMNQVPFGTGYFFLGDRINPSPTNHRLEVHKSDTSGIGYDRTTRTGSGYTGQYADQLTEKYNNPETTPESELLFFHHLPYTYKLESGKTLLQTIYDYQYEGVAKSKWLLGEWEKLENKIDSQRFAEVKERLEKQLFYAEKWKNSLTSFFYTLSEIDDEQERIPDSVKADRPEKLFLTLLDGNKNVPVYKLEDKDSILTIDFDQTLKYKDYAVCKFNLPWEEINYYAYDKVFNLEIKSTQNKTDTLWYKIGEFEFKPMVKNFHSEDFKTYQIDRIGHFLGNGVHKLIIKNTNEDISIRNIQVIRAEYKVDL